MNLGVETPNDWYMALDAQKAFQHSLMNLGVETRRECQMLPRRHDVSAFSDESWGGDPFMVYAFAPRLHVFQHSLMNLGVETPVPD